MPVPKDLFLLDPALVFLNHGSFGATPRPVFDAYQDWQRRLERQPVQFLARELPILLLDARTRLGAYLNAPAQDLAFITNATYGVNAVIRSLNLEPGGEILTSDHEYGACDRTLDYVASRSGAQIVRQPIPLPVSDAQEIEAALWQGVSARTRLIFLSHITSPTALTMPVEDICRRARAAGILTFVDGAHAPGQIPVDLQTIGADFYTGNCHKWMMAPKGAAFLYARPEVQPLVEPLVVSWGWKPEPSFTTGSHFVDTLQWLGTRDPSAALTVPAALCFMEEHDWPQVSLDCQALLEETLERIGALTGEAALYAPMRGFYRQMACARLPVQDDLSGFQTRLYEQYRIEIPCIEWNGMHLMRISVQGYNTPEELDALIEAVRVILNV